MSDPLAGLREALNRGELEVLIFPVAKCPVAKGQVFPLRSCQVEITSTKRTLVKGEWRWEARFNRYTPDIPRIPASQHGLAHPPQYVKSAHGAVDGIGEEVPADYQRRLGEEARAKDHWRKSKRRFEIVQQEQRLEEVRKRQMSGAARLVESRLGRLRQDVV